MGHLVCWSTAKLLSKDRGQAGKRLTSPVKIILTVPLALFLLQNSNKLKALNACVEVKQSWVSKNGTFTSVRPNQLRPTVKPYLAY